MPVGLPRHASETVEDLLHSGEHAQAFGVRDNVLSFAFFREGAKQFLELVLIVVVRYAFFNHPTNYSVDPVRACFHESVELADELIGTVADINEWCDCLK